MQRSCFTQPVPDWGAPLVFRPRSSPPSETVSPFKHGRIVTAFCRRSGKRGRSCAPCSCLRWEPCGALGWLPS
jgi:hypothetical protein